MENTVERNHVRVVTHARPVFRAVAGVALALLGCGVLAGCDKGPDPKPEPKYLLYAAIHGLTEGWIAVIDCATDSVIDSVSGGFQADPWVAASPDGKYFAVLCSGRPPEIFDAATRTQIKYLSAPSIGPVFLPSARIVISPGFDSALIYDLPGFNLKEVWPRPRWFTEPVGSLGRFASADHQHDSTSYPSFQYIIFNPDGTPTDSFAITPDSGSLLQVDLPFTFSQDGTRFFGLAFGDAYGLCLAGYDLTNHLLLFLQRTGATFQHCRVSPDGREVWTTDHGDLYGLNPDHVGSIHVHDAFTGSLKDSISVFGCYPDSNRSLAPGSIRFLPNSEKVYINSVGGPILVINAQTKKIDKLIFPDLKRSSEDIDLAPCP